MLLHHIELNVVDLDASFDFYTRFFTFLGHSSSRRSDTHFEIHFNGLNGLNGLDGLDGRDGFYLWVNRCSPATAARGFHRYNPGLNHLAFRAPDRARVDAWHADLVARGVKVLDPPDFYGPAWYAVYFEDPDGMKLELGHESPAPPPSPSPPSPPPSSPPPAGSADS